MATKTLLLIRHAKSSWDDPALKDIDRPLNPRGLRDAPFMGRQLVLRKISPDSILSSPARRARSTAELLADELGYDQGEILIRDEIYQAERQRLLELVHEFDDRLEVVLLIGHNPELTAFANWLGDLDLPNIPTTGIVALRFPIDRWSHILPGTGHLLFFDYPKKYR